MKTTVLLAFIFSLSSSLFAGESLSADIDRAMSRNKACVTANTLVTLADGNKVKISTIKSGQSLLNANGNLVKVLDVVAGPEKKSIYLISFSNGASVEATEAHPFISENGYFVVSNELSIGDKVKSENGVVSVTAISQESTPQPVYNLLLVEEDMFIKADRNASLKIANGSELNWKQTLRKQYPFLGLSEQEHTFYINGIQSGDLVIQMSLLQ